MFLAVAVVDASGDTQNFGGDFDGFVEIAGHSREPVRTGLPKLWPLRPGAESELEQA